VGKQFGVIKVIEKGAEFEIATFRKDLEYQDGRRPKGIIFAEAREDALRRDFTINGLFYDPWLGRVEKHKGARIEKFKNGLVIDYVGGLEDLKKKILRFIGEPKKRIAEDNLRILRAVRFKSALKFKYDPETQAATSKTAYKITNVSAERIREELNAMLKLEDRERTIEDLSKLGILKYILPEVEKMRRVRQPKIYHKEGDVFTHTLDCLKALPSDVSLTLCWGVLLHDIGKPHTFFKDKKRIRFNGHAKYGAKLAYKICRRLKFSKTDTEEIVWLVEKHMILGDIPKMRKAKKRKWLHDPRFKYLLALLKADAQGTEPHDLSLYNKLKRIWKTELAKPLPPKRLISGNDIMKKFNLPSGPKIGELLEIAYDAQLEGKITTKKQGLKLLTKYINKK
jgi:poly(A) polymerase